MVSEEGVCSSAALQQLHSSCSARRAQDISFSHRRICFSHLFLSSSNLLLDGLLPSLVSTNAIDPSHNWNPYSGTLTLSQRVSNTNPAPPADTIDFIDFPTKM